MKAAFAVGTIKKSQGLLMFLIWLRFMDYTLSKTRTVSKKEKYREGFVDGSRTAGRRGCWLRRYIPTKANAITNTDVTSIIVRKGKQGRCVARCARRRSLLLRA